MQIPDPGFFDFDGIGNYANQTAPIFDVASSLGLNGSDVLFTFVGVNPQVLNIPYGPSLKTQGRFNEHRGMPTSVAASLKRRLDTREVGVRFDCFTVSHRHRDYAVGNSP